MILSLLKIHVKSVSQGAELANIIRETKDSLMEDSHSLEDRPHLLFYSELKSSDRAVYLTRQFIHTSLEGRSRRIPFPTFSEKLWLLYQLLRSLDNVKKVNVTHSDVTSRNVLLTSYDFLMLTDFASTFQTIESACGRKIDCVRFFLQI